MVEMERIELSISGCKPDVFPLALHPQKLVRVAGIEPATSCSQSKRTTRLCYTRIFILVPQEGIEPPHPAYKTGPLPLRIQGQKLKLLFHYRNTLLISG